MSSQELGENENGKLKLTARLVFIPRCDRIRATAELMTGDRWMHRRVGEKELGVNSGCIYHAVIRAWKPKRL